MAAPSHSIRRQLLARLMGPLLLVMVLGGVSAWGLARHFSQTVLDHWLHDSAVSLANRVHWDDVGPAVDLPEVAREILEWDLVDRVYFEVVSADGERLAGNAFLPPPPAPAAMAQAPLYYDGRVDEAKVRVLAISRAGPAGAPVIVKVAETQLKRQALASQVLWISVALSLVLVAVSAAVIWYAIGSGMASIESAVRKVRDKHARAPLSALPPDPRLPAEVAPLVLEINDLVRHLAAAHRLNQRFIADAAHQLRTPLAALRVHIDFALREADPGRHRQALEDAVRTLGRMGRTLHQLLTLAKADESDYTDETASAAIDLDLIAREELEHRIDDALAAGIDLGYAGTPAAVKVRGVEALVREAIGNLLDNALRYSGRGTRVTVGVDADPAQLFVEDDGPGIAPAERAKVLERFYRIPGVQGDGCGLGLSIAGEIIRRHGGTLVLESAFGARGLRARLLFPSDAARA